MNPSLRTLLDDTLIAGLPPSLKAAIDAALAKGGTRREILRLARQAAKFAPLTLAAVEAYLDRRTVT